MTGGPSDTSSITVSSEPLSADPPTWLEVPEYSMLVATRHDDEIRRQSIEIDA